MKGNKRELTLKKQENIFVSIGAIAAIAMTVIIFMILYDTTNYQMTDDWKTLLVIFLGIVILFVIKITEKLEKNMETKNVSTVEYSFVEVLIDCTEWGILKETVNIKSEEILDSILSCSMNDSFDISKLKLDTKKKMVEDLVEKIELTGEMKLIFKNDQQKIIYEKEVTADYLEEIFEYREDQI